MKLNSLYDTPTATQGSYKLIGFFYISLRFSILLLSIFLVSCKHQELKIESTIPCEYSYSDGICDTKLSLKKEYTVTLTKDSRIDTYSQLSNYLYFKSRYSAGFILKFNRRLVLPEKEILKSTYKVYYNYLGNYGLVDGLEMGDDYVYSYIYLGTLLLEKQKEKREESKNFPKSSTLNFPIEFRYKSELFEGVVQTEQEIKIIKE